MDQVTTPVPQSPAQVDRRFRPGRAGVASRSWVGTGLLLAVILTPLLTSNRWDTRIALAAIYGIIGLSINVLTGYAGLVSLGHQALVGVGAFVSAWVATKVGVLGFVFALPVAGLAGAALALSVGLVALRARFSTMALALATLTLGLMAEATIFGWTPLSGGRSGVPAPRPAAFHSDQAFAYLCLALLGLVVLIDWRLGRTKAGRALVTIHRDERIAASLGIDVAGYRILAFALSGFLAGAAGSLMAHLNGVARPSDFTLLLALTWVLMAVVGGLRSRAGVVIGSAFFAILPFLLPGASIRIPLLGPRSLAVVPPLAGAVLLVLTLVVYPAGLGGQLLPIRRWLAGGPFRTQRRTEATEGNETAEVTVEPDVSDAVIELSEAASPLGPGELEAAVVLSEPGPQLGQDGVPARPSRWLRPLAIGRRRRAD